jgi:hypothetical protein
LGAKAFAEAFATYLCLGYDRFSEWEKELTTDYTYTHWALENGKPGALP